ncbi:hypothetical protein F5Y03DRAFT_405703 [Xylaria venustula]|nr:hypothetical protein F5Y03DRAFT_405703 [Xylaria venustula]
MAATVSNSSLSYCPNIASKWNVLDIEALYEPVRLGQFRLLKAEGFDNQGCLISSLHHRDLQEPGPYVAISYIWNEKDKLWYEDYDTSPKSMERWHESPTSSGDHFCGLTLSVSALSGHVTHRVFYSADDLGSLGQGARESLLEVLENSRHYYGCSDPRDMLYSRLALASDASTLIPHPDYMIAVEELYERSATNCIMLTKSLKVITFANSTTMNLQSWVPDWSFKQRPWDATGKFSKLSEEIAGLRWDEKDLSRISRCRQELMVQGRTLGEVTKRDWLETIASRTMGFS